MVNMVKELSPCPFCGYEHPKLQPEVGTDIENILKYVECPNCGANGGIYNNEEDAVRV